MMHPRSGFLALFILLGAMAASGQERPTSAVLRHSEVCFMYASTEDVYKAYGATFVAWGGASTAERVRFHHNLGLRCTGSMWCLTAGARALYEDPKLFEATARDIEGKPVEVPWLFDHRHEGMRTYFGCTNHPAFREHCRRQVRAQMGGGADGLHIDDHLGVAQPATAFGGGLCDHCIAGFRAYLRKHATPEQLARAGVKDLDAFDYRDLIRRHVTTREQYRKVQYSIPLMDLFTRYHLEAAADFVRELGEVGAQAAGHPILLSANAWVGDKRHTVVAPHLTHIVCEVEFDAPRGTAHVERAIEAFRAARALGKPLVGTASGWDWAYIKANGAEALARFWIALTYAHGQRFMAPHPKRQWCFTSELGTHWYAAPVEAFAPMYRFIRANAQWFDGFEEADVGAIESPANVLCTARRKGAAGPIVLHAINRDYDAGAKRMRPRKDVRVTLPAAALEGLGGRARLLRYDGEPRETQVQISGQSAVIELPDLELWTLVVIGN